MSWARHGDQAAGPAARASGFGEVAQQVEDVGPALNGLDEGVQSGGIGMITFGSQGSEGEVMPHQELDQLRVCLVEPDRSDCLASDRRSTICVVHAGTGQLADVVEEAGQQQDVRPLDPGEVLLHLGDRLDQMPVDGMTVDWIVLWPGADRLPGGIHLLMQPARSRRLPHRDDVGAEDSSSSRASRAESGHGVGSTPELARGCQR